MDSVRSAEIADLDGLATVWHDGWHDAHAHLVPVELTRQRTLASFRSRLAAMVPDTRVVGPVGAPVGLCVVQGHELYQLFVAAEARGAGVAAALIADAEQRLSQNGADPAWLSCAMGNERAARFYEKQGWHRAGTFVYNAETDRGTFPLEVWRYEKRVTRGSSLRSAT